jgi:hypothetical protein
MDWDEGAIMNEEARADEDSMECDVCGVLMEGWALYKAAHIDGLIMCLPCQETYWEKHNA